MLQRQKLQGRLQILRSSKLEGFPRMMKRLSIVVLVPNPQPVLEAFVYVCSLLNFVTFLLIVDEVACCREG